MSLISDNKPFMYGLRRRNPVELKPETVMSKLFIVSAPFVVAKMISFNQSMMGFVNRVLIVMLFLFEIEPLNCDRS